MGRGENISVNNGIYLSIFCTSILGSHGSMGSKSQKPMIPTFLTLARKF
jgi:hypothetical protein